MADVVQAFLVIARRGHGGVRFGVGDFKLDDVNAGAGVLEFGVQRRVERAETQTDAKGGFAAQGLYERQHDLADHDGILARLDVHIRDAGRAVMHEQFGKLIVFGAETVQGTVVAPHAAVGAIFAAIIRDFDHGTDKNPFSEVPEGGICSTGVQRFLGFAP